MPKNIASFNGMSIHINKQYHIFIKLISQKKIGNNI
jgi:plasmid maintenance system killer protein